MNKAKLAVAFATAGLLSVGIVHARTIDNFNEGDASVVVNTAAPDTGTDTDTGLTATATIGSTRNIFVDKTTGGVGTVNAASGEVIGGLLGLGNGPSTDSEITITWDNSGAGFTPEDLTDGGTSEGFFLSFPTVTGIDNPLTVEFTVNSLAVGAKTFPDGSVGNDFFIPFSSFTNQTELAAATRISVAFSGPTAWDAEVDFIETRPQPAPVPGTLALLGIGLAGLGVRRMKRAQS
jgi:hypothetical protein